MAALVFGKCAECGCRLAKTAEHVHPDNHAPICVTCYAIVESIGQSAWLLHHHEDWKKEQAHKKRLLEG